MSLRWPDALRWRAARQLAAGAPAEVAGRLLGLHAQVASSAVRQLAVRTPDDAGAWVTAALADRSLVKTWTQRGTLHLHRAEDLPLWWAALGSLRPRYEQPAWQRTVGLDLDGAHALYAALDEVLSDAPLTRVQLADAVVEATGSAALRERLLDGFGSILKPAAFEGRLCFGPPAGREVTFVAPRAWLGEQERPDAQAAIAALVRRHLHAYGPARREDVQRFFGLPSPAVATRWLAALGDEAVAVDVEGAAAWVLAQDRDVVAAGGDHDPVALPAFDALVVGAPRGVEAWVPDARRAAVYRPQGWFTPVVVADGAIAGTWTEAEGLDLWQRTPAAVRRDLEAQVERLLRV